MKKVLIFIFSLLFTLQAMSLEKSGSEFPFELSGTKEAFLLSSGLGFMTSYFFEQSAEMSDLEVRALDKYDINSFDRCATELYSEKSALASDVILGTVMAAPVLFFADKRLNRDFKNAATYLVMYAESLILLNGITETFKVTVQRKRPYAYNESLSYKKRTSGDYNLSFLSGHTANVFNSAVFLSTVFTFANPGSKWVPVVWTASLSVASTVAVLRVAAGKHYPTDVIAGAVLGSVTGLLIPLLHKVNKKNLSVFPVVSSEYGGLQAVLNF
ncbi:MAG TPA: phosphatase PAP2 family protein [bacterium]|nr:phosphatase PAP2 family protein [bacterium]HPS29548.1 phosphatase PAP2 family protein [bacterium]